MALGQKNGFITRFLDSANKCKVKGYIPLLKLKKFLFSRIRALSKSA